MAEHQLIDRYVFPTAGAPAEHLPRPEHFRGTIPQEVSWEEVKRVQREADATYQLVKFKGVWYEHIVFNPNGDPDKTIGFVPTSYSGARKNPGNMWEKTLDALAMPDVPIDYLTPAYNHPAGPLRPDDYKYVLRTSRYTKGTGEEGEALRPIDSMKDIVELYEKQGWTIPRYFSGDNEAMHLLFGRASAFGTAKGAFINGLASLVNVKGFERINAYADLANRISSLGGKAVSLEVNGATRRITKKNMRENVYPWNKYYAHQAPFPFLLHIPSSIRAARIYRAYNRHNDINKVAEHAGALDLRAMMAINDSPVTFEVGSENPLGPANQVKTFFDDFVHKFPDDLRSPHRTITLLITENEGVDSQTRKPTGRTAVERRTFGFGAMLGVVQESGNIVSAAEQRRDAI